MKHKIAAFERQLCDIQGRLFKLALKQQMAFPEFAEKFMNSESAQFMDLPYDRLQWSGEEYILENVLEEIVVPKSDSALYGMEEVFWMGYVYRYWHFYTGESSREIYQQADAELMRTSYMGFHTLDVEMAIDNLKEIYEQRCKWKKNKRYFYN